MNPEITAVITTHGRPVSVREALASVQAELHRDLEVVVVDDGGAFVAPAGVRVIHGAHLGVAQARNLGLAAARGEFVIYLDDDDVAFSNRVSSLLSAARQHQAGLVFGMTRRVMPGAAALLEDVPTHLSASGFVTFGDLLACAPHVNAVLARTEALRAAGGFDAATDHFDDWAAWLRIADAGAVIRRIAETVAEWRIHHLGLSGRVLRFGAMKRRILALFEHLQECLSDGNAAAVATARRVVEASDIATYDDYARIMAAYNAHKATAEILTMNRTTRCLAVCAALLAANVLAEPSAQYRNWGNSAIRYLMMKQEKANFAMLKTDADAKAFIDLFWARRDPTPDTPVNELRQQIETRLAEADKRYRAGNLPGSQSDRGLVYVLLGEPSEIVNRVTPPRPLGSTAQFQRPVNLESWIYRNEAAQRVAGTKSFDIVFDFHDEKYAAEFELDEPSQRSFESVALVMAKSVLKRPFMTAADLAAGGVSGRTVPFRLIVVGDDAIAHDVLRRAQEGEDFSALARTYSSHASAQQGGYVGRIAFADLTDDFKLALADKKPGTAVLITRRPQFAIVRLLTEEEAAAADAELSKPK